MGYDFGPEHPLQPIRLRLTYELIRALGILTAPGVVLISPRMATEEELALVHSPEYIRQVKDLSQPGARWRLVGCPFGLGTDDNPVFEGMHSASAYTVGGSLVAAEQVIEGRVDHAFNMAGGLHHAHPAGAAGFCVYNDAAVAIASLWQRYQCRAMYVDFDAHHGDGVQEAFYDSPHVLTVSIHESGHYLYPGTGDVHEIGRGAGQGYSVNVPLEPLSFDELYLEVFRQIVPPLARRFRPDVIVTQMGCDTHWSDPLAHLLLTLQGYQTLYREVHELVHQVCDGRWVAVGGGGYQVHTVVPRAWTLLFAEMCDLELENEVPAAWASVSQQYETEPVSMKLLDERSLEVPEQRIVSIRSSAQAAVEYIKEIMARWGKVEG